MADAYNARVDTHPHNALYDRPAVFSVLPPLTGLTILDAGCGSGWYAQQFLDHGAARVVCVDVSQKMAAAARARLGERVQVLIADLAQPLTFAADGEFDLVCCAVGAPLPGGLGCPPCENFSACSNPAGCWLFPPTTHNGC